jgi:hypothetical protein
LIVLEKRCWKEHLQASESIILNRIAKFKGGQWVAEIHGRVMGVLYTQRINNVEELRSTTFENVHALHDETGEFVQLISISSIDAPVFRDSDKKDTMEEGLGRTRRNSYTEVLLSPPDMPKQAKYNQFSYLSFSIRAIERNTCQF